MPSYLVYNTEQWTTCNIALLKVRRSFRKGLLVNIKLIADSTCDLSEDLIKKHNIRITPLSISAGSALLKDGIEITLTDIFDYVENKNTLCSTSAVNIEEYLQVYKEERPKCDAIIQFTISSEMSSCYQNACLAAQDFDNIFVIDSRNLSTGIGHLVLDAAELAAEGKPASEIAEILNQRTALVDATFIIDTLHYLHKGGRCSSVAALASNLLNIKPCIVVEGGSMKVGKKYRGKLDSVLRKYVEERLSDKESIDTRRIFVTHTVMPENREIVDMVNALLPEVLPFDEIHETMAGSTIACHCGPNTLGILFFRKAV